jgi:aminopeptidase N
MVRFARLSSFLFLVILVSHLTVSAQRLPSSVTPSHYKLFLDPSIAAKVFYGEETIDVQVFASATKEIVLNSLDLDISLAEIISNGTTQTADVEYDKPNEMIRLRVAKTIPAGASQLHLKWSAPLTDGLRGLYLSKTARRTYLVTQFEGTYARMMFPCFDEPGYKATFDLTVTAENGDTAISNGKLASDTPIDGTSRHTLTFATSPKMSSYLVAVTIGDWQCLENNVDGVPIRVCAVPEDKNLGRFALDVATHSIQFYDKWYGIKYPFGKLDMVAIPDYEWGGMENTASIFYRDSALLMDDSTATVFKRRAQATVIAHEIAHQWFGDLVTPAWWDDIWLNEGFATWMERKPIIDWHPEWHLENDAAVSAQEIISLDSLGATRAIHGDPMTSSDIKEMFDGITYEKGGAVLSMLESYVGPDKFREGVNAYLKQHANGSATAADFWTAMAKVSGKPVDEIMPTFVMQAGVPVLTMKSGCTKNKATVNFAQQRFFLSTARNSGPEAQLWQIPICLTGPGKDARQCIILAGKEQEFKLDGCPAWLFANRDAKGYYRVAYSSDDLQKLGASAETQLSVPERVALVEDAWAMTRAGRSPVATFLTMIESMRSEHDLNVVELLSGHLKYIADALVPPEKADTFEKFVREQFSPVAHEIGWMPNPGDSDEKKALRATLLRILGKAGDPDAIAKARDLVRQYDKGNSSVEGTLARAAFEVASASGDAAFFERLSQGLTSTKSADQYSMYMNALESSSDPAFGKLALNLIKDGTIRQQNYPAFFGGLLANPSTREIAWAYLKDHWSALDEKVTSFGGNGAVSALGSSCSTEVRDDIKQFFSTHTAPGAERTVQQSLERIDNCIAFKQAQGSSMNTWLAGR